MPRNDWLHDLYALAYRLQGHGVAPDLAGLSACELWGVYCFLRRIAEG